MVFTRIGVFSSFARVVSNAPSALRSYISPCTSLCIRRHARGAVGPPPGETLVANPSIVLQ